MLTVHARLGAVNNPDIIPSVADFCRWNPIPDTSSSVASDLQLPGIGAIRPSTLFPDATPEQRIQLGNSFYQSVAEYRIPMDGPPPHHSKYINTVVSLDRSYPAAVRAVLAKVELRCIFVCTCVYVFYLKRFLDTCCLRSASIERPIWYRNGSLWDALSPGRCASMCV